MPVYSNRTKAAIKHFHLQPFRMWWHCVVIYSKYLNIKCLCCVPLQINFQWKFIAIFFTWKIWLHLGRHNCFKPYDTTFCRCKNGIQNFCTHTIGLFVKGSLFLLFDALIKKKMDSFSFSFFVCQNVTIAKFWEMNFVFKFDRSIIFQWIYCIQI